MGTLDIIAGGIPILAKLLLGAVDMVEGLGLGPMGRGGHQVQFNANQHSSYGSGSAKSCPSSRGRLSSSERKVSRSTLA